MSENTEKKLDSSQMTDEEIGAWLFNNHMEKLKERLERYDELKKDDIKINFLYLHFKEFLGDIGYLLQHSNSKVVEHLLNEFVKQQAQEIEMSLRFSDDLKLRYLMERFVVMIKTLFKQAELDIRLERPRPLPTLKVELEPKLPVFICFECERKHEPRDAFLRMQG